MAKYRRFYYSAGYVGTETKVIMKFDDSYTDDDIERIFNEWVEEQHSWNGNCIEVDESEVCEDDIEDEYR